MKSKELKTYNLPADNALIGLIDAKPTFLFALIILLGLFSFMTDIPKAYGLSVIGFSFIALAYTPRVVLMEFYNDYMVLYNKADRNNCVLIYYEDVVSWYYTWGPKNDFLYIELADGSSERIEAFSKRLFESNMNRFLKDKRKRSQ